MWRVHAVSMDVGAAARGAVSGARSAAVRGPGHTAGHSGHRSTDRRAGAHARNGSARAAPLAEDSDSSGEDTANVKVRKLFIPSPTEGVSVLAGIVRVRPPATPGLCLALAAALCDVLGDDVCGSSGWCAPHVRHCVGVPSHPPQITGTAPYLDKLIAIQKLNGMFLRLKSFVCVAGSRRGCGAPACTALRCAGTGAAARLGT